MKQEILVEEIKKILDNSAPDSALTDPDKNNGPYPDILPVILHKLKNKLTPILGYAQILQMKNSDDLLIEKINKIERNAVELTELFENLKDSLIIKKPSFKDHNINELVTSEIDIFRMIRENGIKVSFELDKNLPLIPLNARMISLLIRNVVQNSITGIVLKGSENGEIRITTGQAEERVFLRIRDNGCGIDQADIDSIWTPFFSRFPEKGGIGLLIAETVMSNHKGKCSVESEPGIFSDFRFEFPFNISSGSKPDISVLISGFSKEETDIIERVTENIKNITIEKSETTESAENKTEKNRDLVFIDSLITREEKNSETLQRMSEESPDTEFILFHSGEFPNHLINVFEKDNIRIVPDRTKLLTIINILATAMNKEE